MKPNPLSSLNHLTVPVGIRFLRYVCACRHAEDAVPASTCAPAALTTFRGLTRGPPRRHEGSRSLLRGVAKLIRDRDAPRAPSERMGMPFPCFPPPSTDISGASSPARRSQRQRSGAFSRFHLGVRQPLRSRRYSTA